MTTTNTPEVSRADRAGALLDLTIENLSAKISDGEVSAGTLREVLALARAAGVDLGKESIPLSSAGEDLSKVLLDLNDVDPRYLRDLELE